MGQSVYLSLTLSGISALALASFFHPLLADTDSIPERVAIKRSLKDDVRFKWTIQGQTQGAGTSNIVGVGGFIPFSVEINSTWFLDVLANGSFADLFGSSIVHTEVDGPTLSTSTRLGHRWFDSNKWMYGFNVGFDTRSIKSGDVDHVTITNKKTISFSQIAFEAEAVNDEWSFQVYGLVPTGDSVKRLNSHYKAEVLETYGIDAGYNINSNWNSTLGYYYQQSNLNGAYGSGAKGRLAYNFGKGVTIGTTISYDNIFETRILGNIKYIFGSQSQHQDNHQKDLLIDSIHASPTNRDARIHTKLNVIETLETPIVDASGIELVDASGVGLLSLYFNKATSFELASNEASSLVDLTGETLL